MKGFSLIWIALLGLSVPAWSGVGIQVGEMSPNKALDDNDNTLVFGIDYMAKYAALGFKVEGFYVDSKGEYAAELSTNLFAEAEINLEAILAADILFFPLGNTFFLQTGVNYTSMDATELENVSGDMFDNQLGLNLGLGMTFFDRLMVQGKVMYTPDAIEETAATLLDMDQDLEGFMATVGWRF